MTHEAWITLAIILPSLYGLVRDLAPPDVIFLGGTVLLAVTGVITPKEAFEGFSNSAILTLAGLFVVAAGMRETGVLEMFGHRILGSVKTERSAMRRLAFFVTPLSAFINNTPIVAMLLPVIVDWCRKRSLSPSRLLIPLSYFTILGGTCTLIGTSTNLVVQGMLKKAFEGPLPGADQLASMSPEAWKNAIRPMTLFELSGAGVPYAILGIAYMLLVAPRLLPRRKELIEQLGEARREYMVEMQIMPGCRLIGNSIETAGLRHLPGLFLIEIDRGGTTISPVGPDTVLASNDRLVFTGVVSTILDLEKIPGLVPVADPNYELSPIERRGRLMSEAVISTSSPLIGESVRAANFRSRYDAAVIAVHRNGARLKGKVGDVVLRAGDALLLQTGQSFSRTHRNNPDFYLVSHVEDSRPLRLDRSWIAVGLFVVLIAMLSASEYIKVMDGAVAALLIGGLMVATRCISAAQARRSIEWEVLITIAGAFGFGVAIEKSGLAHLVAEGIVRVSSGLGNVGALAIIYLVAMLFTECLTHAAAAVMVFPFCLSTAMLLGVSPRPFIMAVALAASASFATPIGYATNMMIYGPGGYKFTDFFRVGLPLNLLLWLAATLIIPRVWSF